ncbi:MAG: 23S rRNA (guanosine(2251)-2'-O)-methyltransferase RlmB [Pseudomonadota bacterium]
MAGNTVWVLGHHAVDAVLRINPERALALHVVINPRNSVQAALIETAQGLGLPVHPHERQKLNKHVGSEQHQGIGLLAKPRKEGNEEQLQSLLVQLQERSTRPPLLLVLDQVQDPHNFGACLRTADAAGVDAVVVAKDNASPITAVVQKVASGAAETLPIFRVTNLARTLDAIKQQGVWLIGTSDQAEESLYDHKLGGAVALVMGAEGKGLRQLTAKKCDSLVSLPMAGSIVSSLNVSVATGVCLYEIVRQRSIQ